MKQERIAVLGNGVYGIPEVARYTKMPYNRVRAWFVPRSDARKEPIFHSDYERHAVSFLNMIDVLVAGKLRELGVTTQAIRKVYSALEKELEIRHPFCFEELYTDHRDIFIKAVDELGNEILFDAMSSQQFFGVIMKDYLAKIRYHPETHMANRWAIADGVTITPSVCFGKPVVVETGTATRVLFDWYKGNNEDAALVAKLFGLETSDILNAVSFEEEYGKSA